MGSRTDDFVLYFASALDNRPLSGDGPADDYSCLYLCEDYADAGYPKNRILYGIHLCVGMRGISQQPAVEYFHGRYPYVFCVRSDVYGDFVVCADTGDDQKLKAEMVCNSGAVLCGILYHFLCRSGTCIHYPDDFNLGEFFDLSFDGGTLQGKPE